MLTPKPVRLWRKHRDKSLKTPIGRVRRAIKISALSVLVFLTISLAVVSFSPGVAANMADSVLRPTIGSTATVALESFFFSVSDFFKQVSYKFGAKPNANIFTKSTSSLLAKPVVTTSKTTKIADVHVMDLSPIDFHPGAFAKLPGEGQWSILQLSQFGANQNMARTFVTPDPKRSYAITSVVKMNMQNLRLHAIAGTEQPGGPIGNGGTGIIPFADQAGGKLVAAFNGGFQYKDGQFGMMVGQKTYVPLRLGLGTLIVRQNGTVAIETYQGNHADYAGAVAVRQNGPPIVENGQVTDATAAGGMARWGLTVTNSMYTWRSGIGVTKDGDLLYAVGPSLNVNTLAAALQAAGAINAIQLDINPYWVRFVTYEPNGTNSYTHQSLLKDMHDGGNNFLHGYNKDFFYLMLK